MAATVLLKTGPNISTDDITPAGARVLPYWSNIPKVSEFPFEGIDDTYASRAAHDRDLGGSHAMVVVGYDDDRQAFRILNSWGRNWGEGGYGWFGYDFWKRNVKVGFVIE